MLLYVQNPAFLHGCSGQRRRKDLVRRGFRGDVYLNCLIGFLTGLLSSEQSFNEGMTP